MTVLQELFQKKKKKEENTNGALVTEQPNEPQGVIQPQVTNNIAWKKNRNLYAIKLLDNNGTVGFRGDVYDWDYHDGSPMRNTLIFFERLRTGLNDDHGFNVSIYGTAKINQKWPF